MSKYRRNVQMLRQWKLIRYLSENPSGCQVEELCRMFEVTHRTLCRDFEALEAVGFPIARHHEGKYSVWTIGPWWDRTFREIE